MSGPHKDAPCLGCEKRDAPRCYSECEDYKAKQREAEAKRAYINDAKTKLYNYEHSNADLAKKPKKRR